MPLATSAASSWCVCIMLPLVCCQCIECGQCASVCPTGAMRERHDIFAVLDLLQDKHTVRPHNHTCHSIASKTHEAVEERNRCSG